MTLLTILGSRSSLFRSGSPARARSDLRRREALRRSRKAPAAERQKRIEEGARKEGKLVLIHTMPAPQSVNTSRCSKKALPVPARRARG